MGKAFIYSLILVLALGVPSFSYAEVNGVFSFWNPEKSEPVEMPQATPPTEAITNGIDLVDLKNQPLPIRRKIVATELGSILLRLNVLYDKTNAAADRLAQNGIGTSASEKELSLVAISLADAKITIDSLSLVANNPDNENVVDLFVGDLSFKDAVISAENKLRESRLSIIQSLVLLKTAVLQATTPAQ